VLLITNRKRINTLFAEISGAPAAVSHLIVMPASIKIH